VNGIGKTDIVPHSSQTYGEAGHGGQIMGRSIHVNLSGSSRSFFACLSGQREDKLAPLFTRVSYARAFLTLAFDPPVFAVFD